MTVAAVAHLVGAPYVLRGSDPATGWDCIACAREVRRILGRPWPGDSASVEWRRLGDGLADIRPGAVLLFRYYGLDQHVGVALTRRDFIHCIGGQGTVLVDFDREAQWARRLRGVYD